jgi:hypothetical protein
MILYDIHDKDLKKAQVAVAIKGDHGSNANNGVNLKNAGKQLCEQICKCYIQCVQTCFL